MAISVLKYQQLWSEIIEMTQRKSGGTLRWIRTAGAAAIVAAGIGTAVYLWTHSSSLSQTDDSPQGKSIAKVKKPSKALIITKTVVQQDGVDWIKLLQEDIVLVVHPGVSFPRNEAEEDSPAYRYKIIHCDTMIGLWSCVKHLQKEQLIYVEEEISDGLPDDITRYVKKLISCRSAEELKDSCV